MNKSEVLEQIDRSHAKLVGALEGLTEEKACAVGLNPNWSVKDALAHMVAWENFGIRNLGDIVSGNWTPVRLDRQTINDFNDRAVSERRERSMADVRAEFDAAHERLLQMVGSLPDDIDEKSATYKIIFGVSIRHLAHHAGQIEMWERSDR